MFIVLSLVFSTPLNTTFNSSKWISFLEDVFGMGDFSIISFVASSPLTNTFPSSTLIEQIPSLGAEYFTPFTSIDFALDLLKKIP